MAPSMHLSDRALRWSIRSIDWLRRRFAGIVELTDDPDAVFRVAIGKVDRAIQLSDGNILQPEDTVIELHLWNEHLFLIPARRPHLRWAVTMRRRAMHSFKELAAHLMADSRFDDVKALYIQPASAGGQRAATLNRILVRYGFEASGEADTTPLRSWLCRYGDNFWLWMMAWTYNPTRSRPAWRFDRRRVEFWISRERFTALYGHNNRNARTGGPIIPHRPSNKPTVISAWSEPRAEHGERRRAV